MRALRVLLVLIGCVISTTALTPKPSLPTQRVLATNADIVCLAQNIYHEARGESFLGQLAVAQVTINRVLDVRWKNTICAVVHSPHQFSWTAKPNKIKNSKAYRQALEIARGVVSGTLWIEGFTSTHYHATKVNPRWNRSLKRTLVIGNHVFYD
jgi:spore germination cell wall hydrolase CwlJ-like protein